MAYTKPKTDWEATDPITAADYNRIKNNLVYLNDKYNATYPNPYTFNPGADMGAQQFFKASKFNMFEDCVEHFQRSGRIITFGERSYYEENGRMPNFNQLNRLEKCIEAYATIPVTSISLSPASISLLPGQSQTVTVTMLPADATNKQFIVKKSASDPFTISMNTANSQFTITAANDAAINDYTLPVMVADDSSISTTLAVHVETAVESVSISGDSSVGINDTIQLTATVLPATLSDKSVTWSVDSGSSYGSVNASGVVTGIAAGTVVIKATSNLDSTKYATKSITVQAIPVTSISVSPSTLEFDELNDTEQLTVTVLPATASNKNVTWSSSNTSVATVDANGLVTAKGSGTCTITATAADGSGVTGTMTVTNSIRIPISSFSLSSSTYTINFDEEFDLYAQNILPANADPGTIRIWRSADTSVLLLNDGGSDIDAIENTNHVLVKGRKPSASRVNITANPNERNNDPDAKSCQVEVTGYPRSVYTDYTEEYIDYNYYVGTGRTLPLITYCLPSAAWQAVTITSSNTNIVSVGNMVSHDGYATTSLTFRNRGTATVTIKSQFKSSVQCTVRYIVD